MTIALSGNALMLLIFFATFILLLLIVLPHSIRHYRRMSRQERVRQELRQAAARLEVELLEIRKYCIKQSLHQQTFTSQASLQEFLESVMVADDDEDDEPPTNKTVVGDVEPPVLVRTVSQDDSSSSSNTCSDVENEQGDIIHSNEDDVENQVGNTSNDDRAESSPANDDDTDTDSSSSTGRPQLECSICLNPYQVNETLAWSKNGNCKHIFHAECITTWMENKHDDCPLCRTDLLENFEQKVLAESANVSEENNNNNNALNV